MVADVHKPGADAEAGEQVGEQRIGASVDGAARDDLIARRAELHERRRDRRHARGHDLRRLSALHPGQRAGQRLVRRVPVARVEEAALNLMLKDLLHPGYGEEGVGRGVADGGVHIAKLTKGEELLNLAGWIELHDRLPRWPDCCRRLPANPTNFA